LVTGVDPRQLQFEFALWMREMIQELIRREFGVGLSLSAVGRLLGRLGLSPQRPLWRAWQADPEAVEKLEERGLPSDPRPGQEGGRDGLLRRRGRHPVGLSRRHHLGPGRTNPDREGHRRPAA
jgi:winged helix-turn-helix protein